MVIGTYDTTTRNHILLFKNIVLRLAIYYYSIFSLFFLNIIRYFCPICLCWRDNLVITSVCVLVLLHTRGFGTKQNAHLYNIKNQRWGRSFCLALWSPKGKTQSFKMMCKYIDTHIERDKRWWGQ